VKLHDGYIECPSSLLAEISRVALPEPRPSGALHLKFEIGGGFLGKDLSVNYGLPSYPGASEVNGVLLGNRDESRVLIRAFKQIPAQLAGRDSSEGSEDWERAFGGLVARTRWDPKFAGLQLVGWFRAHRNASLSLSSRDAEVFKNFFLEPWQFGVVLQPEDGKSAVRFFSRERDGSIDPQTGFQDVVVRWDRETVKLPTKPVAPLAASSAFPRVRLRQPPAQTAPLWPVVVLLAAGFAAGAWWLLRPPQPAPAVSYQNQTAATDLRPDATRQAEALWKQWENEARQKQNDLPPLEKPVEVEEEAHNSPLEKPVEKEAHNPPLGKQVEKETHTQTRPLPPILPERSRPAANRKDASSNDATIKERLAKIRDLIRSSPTSQARSVPTAEPKVEPVASRQPVLPPAPAPDVTPPALPPADTPPPALPVSITVPAPTKARPTGAAAPVPAAPSSGRLIWTGHLRKNEDIVFEGGRASTGSANGALPGRPIRLTISPGSLTKNGLVIYTARLPRAGDSQEPPGPQNGWNKTVYEWEPSRTADIEVVEAPNASNAWKRLVLRAKNPKNSIIMVEWNALP
jgi:hypothetical protein